MMPGDTDRIYELLKGIQTELSDLRKDVAGFRQDTEKRLAALEERGSAERFKNIEESQRGTDREVTALRTQVKIYVALAGAVGSIVGPVALKLLHLG